MNNVLLNYTRERELFLPSLRFWKDSALLETQMFITDDFEKAYRSLVFLYFLESVKNT